MTALRNKVQNIVHFAIPPVGETYDVRERATVQVTISDQVEAYVLKHFDPKGKNNDR